MVPKALLQLLVQACIGIVVPATAAVADNQPAQSGPVIAVQAPRMTGPANPSGSSQGAQPTPRPPPRTPNPPSMPASPGLPSISHNPHPPVWQPYNPPPSQWHDGHWYHGDHHHRGGWWWVIGDVWFWYPVPVYPYPNPYVPMNMPAPTPPNFYWYYCKQPPGYYPYVTECDLPWIAVPATPPPPPP